MFSLLKPGVVMNYKLTWASAGGGAKRAFAPPGIWD